MTKLDERACGVYIIAATPFADDGAVDFDSIDRLTDFYLGHGVTGITLLGMMGEAPKLLPEESSAVVRRVLARVGDRVPVVVGVSAGGLGPMRVLAHDVMVQGAAGVMVVPPPGLKGDDGVVSYFCEVADTLGPDIPLIYQDYPQATGVYLSVPAFNRLVDRLPQLVMLKHEDCPGLAKLSRVRASAGEGGRRRVSILVGNGGLYYPQELARGADGAMTGFAYPEMLVEVYRRFTSGDAAGGEDLFDAYLPLVRHEQQPGLGLAIRKEILFRRRAIACPRVRAPGPSLTADDHRELDGLMRRLERRLAQLG
jgi:4-hydroxy-tetrahydrodipicolinate synthase